jgi:hypothetical protein
VQSFHIGQRPERIVQGVAFGGCYRSWFRFDLFLSFHTAISATKKGDFTRSAK